MFTISIIFDDKVSESKGGFLSHVDDICELDTLQDFAEVGMMTHIAPGIFTDNKKRQDHLKEIQFVCFDFDNGQMTANEVHQKLKYRYNHVILGSKNHLKDKGDGKGVIERFHLFIPMDKPISSVDFYKFIGKKLSSIEHFAVDNNCIEPARYFYRHSSILHVYDSSKNLETERFLRILNLQKQIDDKKYMPTDKVISQNIEPLECFKKTKYYKMMTNGELNCDGERYAKSCQIIGGMIICGLGLSDMMTLFDLHSNYGKSFTRNSIERRINNWQ